MNGVFRVDQPSYFNDSAYKEKGGFAGNNYRKIPCKTPIKGAYKRKSPAARYLP